MKLIVGLGNPGNEYLSTRHNIGFSVIEEFSKKVSEIWKSWGQKKRSEIIQCQYKTQKIILLRPQTYMNLSGESVIEVAHFFKILPEEICVIHDDLDLPFGDVRLKVGGGEGGHNGLKSITKHLSFNDYSRIRVGIDKPKDGERIDVADYVLTSFNAQEEKLLPQVIDSSIKAIDAFIDGPQEFLQLMNEFNRRK